MKKIVISLITIGIGILLVTVLSRTQEQGAKQSVNSAKQGARQPMNAAEQEIKNLLETRNQAMIDRDIPVLDQLMADDLILTHMSGAKQTKDEWLSAIEDQTMRYNKIDVENLSIKVDGQQAEALYRSIIDANIYGSQGTWKMDSTTYLEKIAGQWQIVSSARPISR